MNSPSEDPYWKLRPIPPTPADELCDCQGEPPLILRDSLGDNPLACADCNLEVPPERIGFSEELAEELAVWQSFHRCFYQLWLDSGKFASWASAELSHPDSEVNVRGLQAVQNLTRIRTAFLWWFRDTEQEHASPMQTCPACASRLETVGFAQGCKACRIFRVD